MYCVNSFLYNHREHCVFVREYICNAQLLALLLLWLNFKISITCAKTLKGINPNRNDVECGKKLPKMIFYIQICCFNGFVTQSTKTPKLYGKIKDDAFKSIELKRFIPK